MYSNLDRFLTGDKCKFILVKDYVEITGKEILNSIVTSLLKKDEKIKYLTYDSPPGEIPPLISANKNVELIDSFSDPFKWKNNGDQDSISAAFLQNFSSSKVSLVIDSLSTLLIHNSFENVYFNLHKNVNSAPRMIALLHADAHNDKECKLIETLASSVIDVRYKNSNNHHVHCINKYSSGKVVEQSYLFDINDGFDISSVKELSSMPVPVQTKKPDPTANLTFNLNLKEDEKENRKKLQLPYMKVDDSSDKLETNLAFNEDDFYDEDDPDDDLDF